MRESVREGGMEEGKEEEAPAVSVNTNEIIPQRQPETLPVGIFVHVILICSNPFRDNPNLRPLFSSSAFHSLSTDAGHLGGVCARKQLHLHEDGRHDHDSFPAAAYRSLQRGENCPPPLLPPPLMAASTCLRRKNPVPRDQNVSVAFSHPEVGELIDGNLLVTSWLLLVHIINTPQICFAIKCRAEPLRIFVLLFNVQAI